MISRQAGAVYTRPQNPTQRLIWRPTRSVDARQWLAKLCAGPALWQVLCRDGRGSLARHFRLGGRRLRGRPSGSLLRGSLAWGFLLLLALGQGYSLVGAGIIWTLPLWLMGFSAWGCVGWILRIAAMGRRKNGPGAMDELNVIPPGPVFIWLLICKLALHEGETLVWLSLLRRIMAGLALFCLAMALMIAAAQIGSIAPLELGALLASLAMIGLVIPLEHRQSVIIACLSAIIVCARSQSLFDKAAAAVAGFTVLQALSYALAVALAMALGALELGMVFALFLLLREGLITALWQLLLHQLNEDDLLQSGGPWSRALGRDR